MAQMNKNLMLVGLLALFFVATAQAADEGRGFVGASFGVATVDDFCEGTSSCDNAVASVRVYGGADINRYTRIETGYRYIDKLEASVLGLNVDIRGHFLDTSLQLGLPAEGPFKFFTKAGLLLWLLDFGVDTSFGASEADQETGVAFRTGAGASYNLTDHVSLRADWDFLLDVGDEDVTGESDVHVFTFGPEYRF